jgi:hypothetical protein
VTDQQIDDGPPAVPDPHLFADRAAPPAFAHVAGIIGFVLLCVAVLSVAAYFIGSGTD